MMINELKHGDITEKIIKSFYKVYNELGFGFLERVYENALLIELEEENLVCEKQKTLEVFYRERKVGNYFADILVENKVIVEIKACDTLIKEHELQLINYLKATNIEVGLLLNFGKEAKFRRKIFTNKYPK